MEISGCSTRPGSARSATTTGEHASQHHGRAQHELNPVIIRACGEPGALSGARRVREATRRNPPVATPAGRSGSTSPSYTHLRATLSARSRGVPVTWSIRRVRGTVRRPATAREHGIVRVAIHTAADRLPEGGRVRWYSGIGSGALLLRRDAGRTARPARRAQAGSPGPL